jgi:hypothetical protein
MSALNPALVSVLAELDPPTMYPAEFTAAGAAKHSHRCQSTFGRHDWNCHRCVELMLGAAPRNGWQHEYFARKLRQQQRSFDFPQEQNQP